MGRDEEKHTVFAKRTVQNDTSFIIGTLCTDNGIEYGQPDELQGNGAIGD